MINILFILIWCVCVKKNDNTFNLMVKYLKY